eukprot:6592167-Pyramimonas_sp.AAC.1
MGVCGRAVAVQYKLDFPKKNFQWAPGQPEAKEVNVQSHFQEPGEETYIRENLAGSRFMLVSGQICIPGARRLARRPTIFGRTKYGRFMQVSGQTSTRAAHVSDTRRVRGGLNHTIGGSFIGCIREVLLGPKNAPVVYTNVMRGEGGAKASGAHVSAAADDGCVVLVALFAHKVQHCFVNVMRMAQDIGVPAPTVRHVYVMQVGALLKFDASELFIVNLRPKRSGLQIYAPFLSLHTYMMRRATVGAVNRDSSAKGVYSIYR